MNKIFLTLQSWGCNLGNIKERFLDNEEFYESCLKLLVDDPNFEKLGEAIDKKEVPQAFDCAHTLKGVIANMEIKPMYDVIEQIVEPLRSGNIQVEQPYQELLKMRKELEELIQK